LRVLLLLLFLSFSFGEELSGLADLFKREGYVVEREGKTVILDLGKGKVSVGEVFKILRGGKEIVHPVTGQVLGRLEEEVGKAVVVKVEDKFSVAELSEDRGVSKGDRVRLSYGSVCYVGSEEGYFKISSLIGEVRKGENCDYVIREFEGGYGLSFSNMALAFFKKAQAVPQKEEDFELKAKFVLTFNSLPLSVDSCDLFGNRRDYLVVLFENHLKVYEVLDRSVVEYASLRLPPGYPISVRCAPLAERGDIILVNIVSGGKMSSSVIKMVGGTPVVLKENIPYFLAVLDRSRPLETFVGQEWDGDRLWGKVKKLSLKGEDVVEEGDFQVPSGFRADSAVMKGSLLVFTDTEGYLKVFEGDRMLFSEGGFGGSYTTAQLPGISQEERRYTFNPRHFILRVRDKDYVGVIKNTTSPLHRFLDITKFFGGEVYLLEGRDKVQLRKVRGRKFEEAIQAVVSTRGGRLFLLTGRTGTLPFQNRGDLFEVEITPF